MNDKLNCLFLEGDRRIGKSTLLRQCISDLGAKTEFRLGGFSSQRLLDADGGIAGFRITDPSDFEVERSYDPGLPGIFVLHKDGHSYDLSVFTSRAEALLKGSLDSDIILLDEIGGIEMGIPSFCDALYEVLHSGIPCIGVLKPASRLERQAQRDPSLLTAFEGSKKLAALLQYNTRHAVPDNVGALKDEIMAFLKSAI